MSTGLSGSLDVLFGKMESFVSTKTVVGEPIRFDGVIIVPLVDVSFGVGAGVSDAKDGKEEKNKESNFGGGGLGGKISPTAVLVIIDKTVQLVSVKNEDSVKKLIDLVPGIISKLNLGEFFKKKGKATDQGEKVEFEDASAVENFAEAGESAPGAGEVEP